MRCLSCHWTFFQSLSGTSRQGLEALPSLWERGSLSLRIFRKSGFLSFVRSPSATLKSHLFRLSSIILLLQEKLVSEYRKRRGERQRRIADPDPDVVRAAMPLR